MTLIISNGRKRVAKKSHFVGTFNGRMYGCWIDLSAQLKPRWYGLKNIVQMKKANMRRIDRYDTFREKNLFIMMKQLVSTAVVQWWWFDVLTELTGKVTAVFVRANHMDNWIDYCTRVDWRELQWQLQLVSKLKYFCTRVHQVCILQCLLYNAAMYGQIQRTHWDDCLSPLVHSKIKQLIA